MRSLLARRLKNPLLATVLARSVGLLVFLIGLYIVFVVSGLTNVALTVLGGTGLLGVVLGIAFRDITENFLASIFLSVQSPFRTGDLVDIAGVLGFVQMLTTRATVLMTLDGNHVQIPNATVYQSKIHNYTSNPNRRVDFAIGIGYDDSFQPSARSGPASAGGPSGGAQRPRAVGAGGESGRGDGELAHLLLAERYGVQLVEGAARRSFD